MPAHGVPSALNTGGSLPDLSSLHFPSPLPTPLDQDEPAFPGSSSLSGGSSTGNLASTLTQLGINAASAQGGNSNFHHHSQGTCSMTDHTARCQSDGVSSGPDVRLLLVSVGPYDPSALSPEVRSSGGMSTLVCPAHHNWTGVGLSQHFLLSRSAAGSCLDICSDS